MRDLEENVGEGDIRSLHDAVVGAYHDCTTLIGFLDVTDNGKAIYGRNFDLNQKVETIVFAHEIHLVIGCCLIRYLDAADFHDVEVVNHHVELARIILLAQVLSTQRLET